jgi:hypothetical protein
MMAGLILWFSSYLLVTILIHEVGHILSGYLCGFQIIAVKVGPVQLQLTNPRQWTFYRKRFFDGSVQAGFRKMPNQWFKWQYFGFLFGGSLANFFVAIFLFPFAIRDTVIANIFAFIILISTFVGFVQLIPFEFKGRISDGAKLYSLFFDKAKREEFIFALSLRMRIDGVKKLIQDKRVQDALYEVEKLISGAEGIPKFNQDVQAMEKLFKFRDTLRNKLSNTVNSLPKPVLNLD